MAKLAALVCLLVSCLSVAIGAVPAQPDPPRPHSPRGIYRRLQRDPIDPELSPLKKSGFSVPRLLPTSLSEGEVRALVIGKVVVKFDGPFADSLIAYQVFSEAEAARKAYAAISVAKQPGVRLISLSSSPVELEREGKPVNLGSVECEHFVRTGNPTGITQCKYLVKDANVIIGAAISEAGKTDAVSDERRDGGPRLVTAAITHGRDRGLWTAE